MRLSILESGVVLLDLIYHGKPQTLICTWYWLLETEFESTDLFLSECNWQLCDTEYTAHGTVHRTQIINTNDTYMEYDYVSLTE